MKKHGSRSSPGLRRLLVCCIFLCSLLVPHELAAQAATDSADEEEIIAAEDDFEGYLDPEALEQPRASEAPSDRQWQELTSGKDFSYSREIEGQAPPEPEDNDRSGSTMPSLPSGIVKFLLILVVAAVAAVILYNILGNGGGFFARKSRRQVIAGETEDTDELAALPPSELERRMDEAAARGDLRLATRLGFLRALQLLDASGLIAHQPEKTNIAYERELGNNALRSTFREMRITYERAWYGGFEPAAEGYAGFTRLFNRVKTDTRG